MNIIDTKDLPINSGCGCTEEEEGYDSHEPMQCHHCRKEITAIQRYYRYTSEDMDDRHLCTDCHGKAGLCCYKWEFFLNDQLVSLNDVVRIHCSETDIIETHQKVPDRLKYLDMIGLNVNEINCELMEALEQV